MVDALAVGGPTWAQMYARHAHADRPAVVSASRAWTFRELTRDATGWAGWLDSADLPPGRPVAVLLGSSPMAYALLLGGALTGRPLAPLGDRLTISELTACLSPLGAGALVADEEHAALGRELTARAGLACHVLPDAAPAGAGVLDLGDDGDAIALVLHTSGTTGLPKPVRFRMDRLGLRARVYAGLLELRPDDVYSSSQQFHHLGGVGLLMVAMAVGAAVVPPVTRFSADSWAALGELGTTHATLAPAMIERLLEAGTIRLPRLRTITYGSSPIRPATAARLLAEHPSIGLLQGYSQTEGGPITVLTPEDHRRAAAHHPGLLGSVGRAVRDTEVIIHRPDRNGIGEVWARGGHLAAPARDGWLHTGDLGRLGADGYLYLSGRKGDMIIRGGENVYPEEVENRIASHPGIREAAVVGAPHEVLGEEVVAFIVPARPGGSPDAGELHRYVRAELAGFKVPARWHVVDELPRGALGKVLRRALRAEASRTHGGSGSPGS
jgi:acyl-CoA synthetase (AMP-forming)/AMP-acid ligase II